MSSHPDSAKALFLNAVEMASASERQAYLDSACAGDEALRREVDELVRHHEGMGSFLLSAGGAKPAAVEEPAISEGPGTMIGPYKLLQQIGEGGMGVVFMAEQTQPVQRKVALKVIKPGMDSKQVIARFEAERQALAMMDHVNIARVLDAGTTEAGLPYFVMELVHGVPITRYCDDNHLTPRERLELFVPVCQAIQHAHQKGIIHRDVKPSNVMVTLYDGKPVPKVIDFGVAKATEQKLTERTLFTQYGTMVGTLEYMSPEQAEMSALGVDTRSDIYSLGVLLYELLTGSTPLTHKRLKEAGYTEILRMIKEEEPPKPSTRLSDSGEALASISSNRHMEPARLTKLLRGELDWIVMKTLEKDRNRRYETAREFAADVQRYLDDEPVQACPPSAVYRLRKFARRNKASLAFTGLVLLILFTLTGGIGWNLRDRAIRQTAVESEVRLALNEAERLRELGKWLEALSAARRAEGVLAGGSSGELRNRVHQLRKDIEMVLHLEAIRLLASEWKNGQFDYESADRAYAKAFADYGIDIEGLPGEEAAASLHARAGVAVALAAALDAWALGRNREKNAGGSALTAIAQAVDPDPWRRQVRQAFQQQDAKALVGLAASPELLRQPPTSLEILAAALRVRRLVQAEIEVRRQAQRLYPGDFWSNFELAMALKQRGSSHLDEAVAFLRAALAVRPQSIAVYNNLGGALHDQEKLNEAIACYRRAIELDPHFATAYCNLGAALREQGKLDQAVACCRKAIELAPKFAAARHSLGNALYEQGKLDEAIASYKEALAIDSKVAQHHYNLGVALHGQKKLDAAIASYQQAIVINPKDAKVHYNLGSALRDQKKLDAAVASYLQAIAINPKDCEFHNNLGTALHDQKKLDEAIASYKQAIAIDPKFAAAHNNLGLALTQKGLVGDAIASYREAIRHEPDWISAQFNWGWLVAAGPDRDHWDGRRAVELATRLCTLAPQDNRFRTLLGAAHYRSGNWNESLAALEQSMALGKGGSCTEWWFLAMVHWQLGNKDEARKWYDRAAAWTQKNGTTYPNLRRYQMEAVELGIGKKND